MQNCRKLDYIYGNSLCTLMDNINIVVEKNHNIFHNSSPASNNMYAADALILISGQGCIKCINGMGGN